MFSLTLTTDERDLLAGMVSGQAVQVTHPDAVRVLTTLQSLLKKLTRTQPEKE